MVNPKTYLVVNTFSNPSPPSPVNTLQSFTQWLILRFRDLTRVFENLTEAAVQDSDVAPKSPRIGTIRYATGAWATALGASGLYVWDGTTWRLIQIV